ncbi:PAS domain S-box protein, partial [bacterium]|nr:PAS domain S-box protein [bacterium]
EALGKNPRVLKSGIQPAEVYKGLWEKLNSGETWEGELCNKRKNGELYWEYAFIAPVRNKQGETTHYVAVKEDITERKKAEEELVLLNQLVYGSLESADVGAWWIDFSEEDTFHALDTTAKLIGLELSLSAEKAYSISEWVNVLMDTKKVSTDYAEAIDETLERFAGTISGKYENYKTVYPVLSKDGMVRWIDARADVPKRDKDGKALTMTGTLIDITEQKERERIALLNADIGDKLISDKSQRDKLQNCCNSFIKQIGAAFVRIWTVDDKENMLHLQASAGLYTHIDGAHAHLQIGKKKIGLIAKEGNPYINEHLYGNSLLDDKEWAKENNLVSFYGYPMKVEGKVVGVLALFFNRDVTKKNMEPLQSIANSIALSIEREQAEQEL